MAELRIFGGDPRIIATLDEIARVAACLRTASAELEAAIWALQTNPIPNLQLAFLAPNQIQNLRNLADLCDLAANRYYSTEHQISAWFQQNLDVLQEFNLALGSAPISNAMVGFAGTSAVVAALATTGLTSKPDTDSVGYLRAAVALTPVMLGARELPQALQFLPNNNSGSAVLAGFQGSMSARNLAEHAKRIRALYANPGQIRIERYQVADINQYVVYIPGTQVASRQTNPLTAISNLHAMAGSNRAPSEKAVRDAIKKAGIEKSDRVLFVGHSQGAMVAANIVSSRPEFQVTGLLSFGGPIAQRDLGGIPTIAFENSGDPVPGLSGETNPLTKDLVTVVNDQDFDSILSAHSIDNYVSSAIAADNSSNPGLLRVSGLLKLPNQAGTASTFDLFDFEDAEQTSGQERGD